MARIRTFIGIDVGEAIRQRAASLQEKLGRSASGVKWVEEHNLHITLLFLGEVDQLDLVSICRMVKERTRDVAPFTLGITGVGAFPSARRPKILWAGIEEGAEELKAIHLLLEEPLLALGCYRRRSEERR